jgi:hypothetical protein
MATGLIGDPVSPGNGDGCGGNQEFPAVLPGTPLANLLKVRCRGLRAGKPSLYQKNFNANSIDRGSVWMFVILPN